MNDKLEYWNNFCNENNIDPRLRIFVNQNPDWIGKIQEPLLRDISKFLKHHPETNEQVTRAIQLCVSAYGKTEFAALFCDWLDNPTKEDVIANPIVNKENPLGRDKFITKDEITNAIIDLECCKSGEDFDKWLETL